MKKIAKRVVLFLFLGMFIFIVIDTICNWEDAKKSFMNGWNRAQVENVKPEMISDFKI